MKTNAAFADNESFYAIRRGTHCCQMNDAQGLLIGRSM